MSLILIITTSLLLLLHYYYYIITSLFYIFVITSLLHIRLHITTVYHFYIVITLLLLHYYPLYNFIITSLLRHYYFIITHFITLLYVIITSLLLIYYDIRAAHAASVPMTRRTVVVNLLAALTLLLCYLAIAGVGVRKALPPRPLPLRLLVQAPPRVPAENTWTAQQIPSVDATRVPARRLPLLPPVTASDWALPPVELRGQVTLQTTFGRELNRLAQLPHVHLVLEIGTSYGGGSGWCIAQGFRSSMADPARPDKWLLTMELFEDAWRYASATLQRLQATCMRAGTVGLDGYLKPEQMTAEGRASEHYRLYYERDVALARATAPLLETLCATYDLDMVLIDCNEYTGLAEFELVERGCRPWYLALHDTGTLKTSEVERRLADQAGEWRKLSDGADAAGWAVYESTCSLKPRYHGGGALRCAAKSESPS